MSAPRSGRGSFSTTLTLSLAAIAAVGLHCSSSSGGGASSRASSCDGVVTPAVGDLPDDVNAVLVDKCQGCHTSPPKNHAPWSLQSFEDTQKVLGLAGKRRWQRMAEVIEPGGSPHMPFGDAPQLTDAQLTTLRTWFAGCAMPIAEGTGHDATPTGPEHDAGP